MCLKYSEWNAKKYGCWKNRTVNVCDSSGGSCFSDMVFNMFIIIYAALLVLFLTREYFSFDQALITTESPFTV